MRINTLMQTSTPRGKRTLAEIEYNVGKNLRKRENAKYKMKDKSKNFVKREKGFFLKISVVYTNE